MLSDKETFQIFAETIIDGQGFLMITVAINRMFLKRWINIHRLYYVSFIPRSSRLEL